MWNKIKHIEFSSYYPKQAKCDETLYMMFVVDDSGDSFMIDIQKDLQGDLFSTTLLHFQCAYGHTYNASSEIENDDLYVILKKVLSSKRTQKQLNHYGMNGYKHFYTKLGERL